MRSIARFLRLLQEISANGPLSVAQLAKASGIPYTSTARIVRTMLHHALIEHEPNSRRFRVAVRALSLSNGLRDPERLLEVNQQLVAKQSW